MPKRTNTDVDIYKAIQNNEGIKEPMKSGL
jgi:hypothetical protein